MALESVVGGGGLSSTGAGGGGSILRSKLAPAEAPPFAVRRPRLERLLEEGSRRKLTLVVAPAGSGKSVLLEQWVADRPKRTVAWLTLDDRDSDPVRLGSHLVAAIEMARPGTGKKSLAGLAGGETRLGDEFIDLLLHDLQQIEDHLVIVVDDVDRLVPAFSEDVGRLLTETPRTVHFVVASRVDPDIPFQRLRSHGDLVELRVADLRFSTAETKDVVENVSGHNLTDEEVGHIWDATEGWPVAVELAAAAMRDVDVRQAVEQFGLTNRTIVDYVFAEVLERQQPELRAFLLDISVLEQVDGELSNAITGRTDGAHLLQELEQRAFLVSPVPEQPGWYRIHRLLREFLRQDLNAADATRPALLLRRAAQWRLDRGEPAEAALCLMAAGEWEPLKNLIKEHGRAFLNDGDPRTVATWIKALPESARTADVQVRLIEAAVNVFAGKASQAAGTIVDLEHATELTRGEQLVADTLMVSLIVAANPQDDTLVRANRALHAAREVPASEVPPVLALPDQPSLASLIFTMTARTRLFLGDGSALGDAERGAAVPEAAPAVLRVHGLGTISLVDALAGRAASAVAAGRMAERVSNENLKRTHDADVFWRAGLAVAARMRNNLDEANARAGETFALARRWQRWPWAALMLGELALIELARGNPDEALSRLRRGIQLAMPPPPPMVDGRFKAIELRAHAAQGLKPGVWPDRDRRVMERSWELAGAAVATALAEGRVQQARKFLQVWPWRSAPLGELERGLATALVEAAEGSETQARSRISQLAVFTAPDGVIQPFLDGGEPMLALLEDVAKDTPSPHLDLILERSRQTHDLGISLVEPLSSRELEVLWHLPSRLTNHAIADSLHVSTNTVKTHLKHIYQKLGAVDRDDAIEMARKHRLL